MIVTPKDGDTARRLLAEASKQGLSPDVVKVVDDGYDVPDSVASPSKPEPVKKAASRPRKTSTRSAKE